MNDFVNRETELALIDEAVEALLDKQRLLRTPIIEFYGVKGIGKTTLLEVGQIHDLGEEGPPTPAR